MCWQTSVRAVLLAVSRADKSGKSLIMIHIFNLIWDYICLSLSGDLLCKGALCEEAEIYRSDRLSASDSRDKIWRLFSVYWKWPKEYQPIPGLVMYTTHQPVCSLLQFMSPEIGCFDVDIPTCAAT